jgi:hypothetical protein
MEDLANSSYPRNALEQAKTTAQGWRMLQQKLDVPSVDIEDFTSLICEAEKLAERAEVLRQERSRIVLERDKMLSMVWKKTKRVRNAAKATFGDDSPDVQTLGILPVTLRKRKAKVNESG